MKLPQEGYDDSRARRLYGRDYDDNNGYFYGPGDYQPIIDDLGTVLVQVDDSDYQGDTRVLLQKDGRRWQDEEIARLLEVEQRYHQLLDSSLESSQKTVGGILRLVMTPGVLEACDAAHGASQ